MLSRRTYYYYWYFTVTTNYFYCGSFVIRSECWTIVGKLAAAILYSDNILFCVHTFIAIKCLFIFR